MDFGRAPDGAPYLVMEYLAGEDCAHLLERHGRLSVARAVDIVRQACRGLTVAHRAGIVHRDLKPENLFITRGGDGSDWVKVLDFGIAKLRPLDSGVSTRTGATFGTAHYMSPEQARGQTEIDARTDVWALGVVLYQLLSGQRPFRGDQFLRIVHQILSADPTPLANLVSDLPPALLDVVAHAMSKDVARRLPSAEALEAALAPFAVRDALVIDPVPAATAPVPHTQLTPATSVDGVSIGDTGIGPRRELEPKPPVERTPGKRRALLLSVTAVAVAATLALAKTRLAPERAVTSAAVATPSLSTPAAPAPAQSRPSVAASAGSGVPAASAAAAPGSAGAPVSRSPERSLLGKSRPVRSLFEQSELGPTPRAAPPVPPSSLPAAPSAQPTNQPHGRTIEIEKGNPYE
jgi:serine/threonine-protein kinase